MRRMLAGGQRARYQILAIDFATQQGRYSE